MSYINKEVIYDPHATITELGSFVEEQGHRFDTATGLGMAIEAIGYVTSTALQEMVLGNQSIFPSLATKTEHLLRHITDDEEVDLFATPAEATMKLYININDLIHNGISTPIENEKTISYTCVIAKNSIITVTDTPFLILDDVNVRLLVDKDNNKSLSILYSGSNESSTYTGIGVLPSNIVLSEDIAWGVFYIPMKQLDKTLNKVTVVQDDDIDVTIGIKDSYSHSELYMDKGGVVTKLSKVFSKEAIDINKPSILISVYDDTVRYRVPKPFLYNNSIQGDIYIYTYTTKGKIELPLSSFSGSDFTFRLFNINKELKYTVTDNMTILATSDSIVDGGVNRRPFKDIRSKIINKTTSNIISPTTEAQLIEVAKKKGFSIFKKLDTITDRTYLAVRNSSVYSESKLPTELDIFLANVKLSTSPNVITDGNFIYVKEGALFTQKGDECIPHEMPNANRYDTIKYLNEIEVFECPFYYTISSDKSVVESKVYDLRKPKIKDIAIVSRNEYLLVSCNITSYRIIKTVNGYDFYLEVAGDSNYTSIEGDTVIQLGFITGSGGEVRYETTPIVIQEDDNDFSAFAGKTLHKAVITTDFLINNGIKLFNDLDTTNSLTVIPLSTRVNTYIMSGNANITNHLDVPLNATGFEKSNITNGTGRVVITKQSIDVELGKEITGLWSGANGLYNEDRFLKYDSDIYKRYDEDVYEQFDGCSYKIEDTTGDGKCDTIGQNKLHSEGDIVEIDGDKVIEHFKGEVILHNGIPVNNSSGIDIFADIILVDYRYKYIGITGYEDHVNYKLDQLVEWCLVDLKSIDDSMLERTRLLFRPSKNLSAIKTNFGLIDGLVKPKMDIYYSDNIELDVNYDIIINTVGKLLDVYFGKRYIDINDMEAAVMRVLPNSPLSVKIEHPNINSNIINVENDNRFRLSKKFSVNNELIYDIDLNIKRI